MPPSLRPWSVQAAIIVGLGMLITLPWLGHSGLAASEGFRALPAWQALDQAPETSFTDRWIVTRLFEQPYLRKPPGMVWAIGLTSSVLGPTEFAARLVSALATIASALTAWSFARRWFGPGPGLMSGLLLLLMPVLWKSAKAAEIEALHNFFALASSLLILDILLARPRSPGEVFERGWLVTHLPAGLASALLALSTGAMLLTKGPAAVPVLACAALAAPIAARRVQLLKSWPLALGLLLGGLIFLLYLLEAKAALARSGLQAVTQEPTEFLWRQDRLTNIALLPLTSLGAALPCAVAVPALIWWWLARLPGSQGRAGQLGVALGLAFGLSVITFTLMGVGNVRYIQPAMSLVAIAAAFAASTLLRSPDPTDTALVRFLRLRSPRAWVAFLLTCALLHAVWFEYRRVTRTSGERAGIELAQLLPDGATLIADQSIDTRPEVFWYAQREARRQGRSLRVLWRPMSLYPTLNPPSGTFVALRDDDRDEFGREAGLVGSWLPLAGLEPVYETTVHVFGLRVFRIR